MLLSSFAFGQNAPTPTLTLTVPNLLKDPSFEDPPVTQRLSFKEKGSPVTGDESKTSWTQFQVMGKDTEGQGKLVVGLTNEYARTGKQSVFVDFDKLTSTNRKSFLMTDLIEVKPASGYRISLWGRTDKDRPLTLDQRWAFMKVEIEYFTPDTENQSGELDNRTLMIPGNSKRIFFVSNKWNEYSTIVRTPRDAGWMKVTFRWETGRDKGTTDGIIYFDDASVTPASSADSLIPVDETDVFKPAPEEEEPSGAAAPATPAEPPKPPAPAKKP